METAEAIMITHDNRTSFPQIYKLKPGPVQIQQLPALQYISQDMNTTFHMDWAGRPEPLDEQWIVWKIVNQLKQMTKKSLHYKFKLMPPEIIWRDIRADQRFAVTQMMQVPDCITFEMYQEARRNVERKLRSHNIPETKFVVKDPVLCAMKLHVGHYRDTSTTLQEIEESINQQGYRIKGSRKEIYLTPAMRCHPPETWKTVVIVEIDK